MATAKKKATDTTAIATENSYKSGHAIEIRPIVRHTLQVEIVSLPGSMLLMNNGEQAAEAFNKTKKEKGKPAPPPPPRKTAEGMFLASQYRAEDGRLYIPAAAFKRAMVDASTESGLDRKDASKTKARGCFYVRGTDPDHPDKVFIVGTPKPFSNIGRVGNPGSKKSCPRTRASFAKWSAHLLIEHSDRMRCEDVLHLLNVAGDSQGVGDWRPGINTSSGGECGRFLIVVDKAMLL